MAEQMVDVLDFVMLGLSNRTKPLGTMTYTKHAALHMPAILVPYHIKLAQLPTDIAPPAIDPVPLPPGTPPPPPPGVRPPDFPVPPPTPPSAGVLPRPPGVAPTTPPAAPQAPSGASAAPPLMPRTPGPQRVTGDVGSPLETPEAAQGAIQRSPMPQTQTPQQGQQSANVASMLGHGMGGGLNMAGAAGAAAGPGAAIAEKVMSKDPNAAMKGLENLKSQTPPGYMDQAMKYWEGLETWQKVLLGAGLSIGAIGLLHTMFGGGGEHGGGGGMMGPLLGIGGLAAGAYGAGLMGDPLGLGKLFGKPAPAAPGVNGGPPPTTPVPKADAAAAPTTPAANTPPPSVNYRASILKAQQSGDTAGAINIAAQMFNADPEKFQKLDEAFKPGMIYRNGYPDEMIAAGSEGQLTAPEVAQLRANWPAIKQRMAEPAAAGGAPGGADVPKAQGR